MPRDLTNNRRERVLLLRTAAAAFAAVFVKKSLKAPHRVDFTCIYTRPDDELAGRQTEGHASTESVVVVVVVVVILVHPATEPRRWPSDVRAGAFPGEEGELGNYRRRGC